MQLESWAQWVPAAWTLVRALIQAAVTGTLFVALVWIVCRLAPRLPANLRCALWWLAGFKLVLGLAWPTPLVVPLFPAGSEVFAWATANPSPAATDVPNGGGLGGRKRAPIGPSGGGRTIHAARPLPSRPPFSAVAVLLIALAWVGGLACQGGRLLRDFIRFRRFLRTTETVDDGELESMAKQLSARLAVSAELRVARPSLDLRPPLTAGCWRPVVILPPPADLSGSELAMALCHELIHVRRRDLLWGWIPAAAVRLFFFLPAAAIIGREYAASREEACDRAVLRALGACPSSYGRLLIRLGIQPAGPRRWRGALSPTVATGSAASLVQLRRRLEALGDEEADLGRAFARLGLVLLVCCFGAGLIPIRIGVSVPTVCPKTLRFQQALAAAHPAVSGTQGAASRAAPPHAAERQVTESIQTVR